MEARVRAESWPIRGGFRIARGARAAADLVVVELHREDAVGRGECVPYRRYGETVESVISAIKSTALLLSGPDPRAALQRFPRGAARNALDCALWDLEAKMSGRPVWKLAGLPAEPQAVGTMRTVSVDTPEQMHAAAGALCGATVIKVKVDGGPDLERVEAVHAAAPNAELVVDANEAWTLEQTATWMPELRRLGVVVLEQPLAAERDAALSHLERAVPICADESFHDRASFDRVRDGYDMVNIKLDKAGGLTEALACASEAGRFGLSVMVGCMVSTSLAIEPALLTAQRAAYVDLDGPLLLEADRPGAQHDRASGLLRPSPGVWGGT
jgi:L-alanine-DL-glutamate epimerase-like enolase superfamily enzyme